MDVSPSLDINLLAKSYTHFQLGYLRVPSHSVKKGKIPLIFPDIVTLIKLLTRLISNCTISRLLTMWFIIEDMGEKWKRIRRGKVNNNCRKLKEGALEQEVPEYDRQPVFVKCHLNHSQWNKAAKRVH